MVLIVLMHGLNGQNNKGRLLFEKGSV